MRIFVASAIAAIALAGCREEPVVVPPLPSGLVVTEGVAFFAVQPSGENWLIVHIVVPDLIDADLNAEEIATDTDAVCADWMQYTTDAPFGEPDQVVVHLASEQVERGQPAPGVRQFFAGYRYEDGSCIWEDF